MLALAVMLAAGDINAQDSTQIYLQKAGKGLADKDFNKARENYLSVLKLEPGNFTALSNLGVVYSTTGDAAKAKEYFLKAYAQNPDNSDLCNNLGAIFSNEGNRNEAIRYFEKALSLDTANVVHITHLGQEYARDGQVSKALSYLYRANSLSPDNPIVLFWLGNSYASSKNLDSANHYYDLAVEKGGTAMDLLYFRGRIKQRLGLIAEAEESFLAAIKLDSQYVDCLQSLAMIYLNTERYKEAVGQFRRVTILDSAYYPGWIGLGASLSLNGLTPQADTVLSKLFAVDSAMGFQMLDIISTNYLKQKKTGRQ
jgi:tetratricopeptide (TPR) repeat protein